MLAYLGVICVQHSCRAARDRQRRQGAVVDVPRRGAARASRLLRTPLRRNVSIALILFAVAAGFAMQSVAALPVAALGALVASMQRIRRAGRVPARCSAV